MADEEIRMRDTQLQELGEELSSLINNSDSSSSLSQDIKDVDNKIKEYRNALDSFKMELRALGPKDKAAYRQKSKEYRKNLKNYEEGHERMKSDANRNNLLGDHDGTLDDGDALVTNDSLMAHGRKLQEENQSSLARTLNKVNESKQIGANIAVKLDAQTQQLEKMDDDLADITDTLNRASKTIKRMARGVASDKIIWILAFLVFIGILAVVVYKVMNPDANVNGVPTDGIDKLN